MEQEKLNEILDLHKKWLDGENRGKKADLSGANLRCANLCWANLHRADLSGAKNMPYIPTICPSEGSFIGWKKVKVIDNNDIHLVKLQIPEDARRSSATSRKCRCDKAIVFGNNQH